MMTPLDHAGADLHISLIDARLQRRCARILFHTFELEVLADDGQWHPIERLYRPTDTEALRIIAIAIDEVAVRWPPPLGEGFVRRHLDFLQELMSGLARQAAAQEAR